MVFVDIPRFLTVSTSSELDAAYTEANVFGLTVSLAAFDDATSPDCRSIAGTGDQIRLKRRAWTCEARLVEILGGMPCDRYLREQSSRATRHEGFAGFSVPSRRQSKTIWSRCTGTRRAC